MLKKYTLGLLALTLFIQNLFAQLPNGSVAPDFTGTDLNGNQHTLYNYLNNGKAVVLDFSASWCSNCWAYHNAGTLETFYNNRGPQASVFQATALFIEADPKTTTPCLSGTNNCTGGTRGNWISNKNHPFIDDASIATKFNIQGYPTILMVCPNKQVYNVGQVNAAGLDAQMSTLCGITPATSVPLSYQQVSLKNNDCFGDSKGAITLSASGGLPPYTFSWNGDRSGASINSLAAGTYNCTITDSKGSKIVVDPIAISQNPKIEFSGSVKDIQACGQKGEIKPNVKGGSGAYTYKWTGGLATPTLTNLTVAQNAQVTITDAKSCTAVSPVFKVARFDGKPIIKLDSIFFNNCLGKAPSVFMPEISNSQLNQCAFKWSANGVTLATTKDFSPTKADFYTLVVTDTMSRCVTQQYVEIVNDSVKPTLMLVPLPALHCKNTKVTLNPTINNVKSPVFEWRFKGENTVLGDKPTYEANRIGFYLLKVIDKINGCATTIEAELKAIADPIATLKSTKEIACFGDQTASLELSVSLGTVPYNYIWSNGNKTNTLENIAAGNYAVTVSDANQCSATTKITVTQPTKLKNDVITVNPKYNNTLDGALETWTSGGTTPYSYLWKKNGSNTTYTDANLSKLGVGTYALTITDNNKCIWTNAQPIVLTAPVSVLDEDTPMTKMRLTPNPCKGRLQVQYHLRESASVEIAIYELTGRLVLKQQYPIQMLGAQSVMLDVPTEHQVYLLRLSVGDKSLTQKLYIDN